MVWPLSTKCLRLVMRVHDNFQNKTINLRQCVWIFWCHDNRWYSGNAAATDVVTEKHSVLKYSDMTFYESQIRYFGENVKPNETNFGARTKKITQWNRIFHLSQITSRFLPYGSTWEEVYISSGSDLMCGKQKATVFNDTHFTDASMRHGTN